MSLAILDCVARCNASSESGGQWVWGALSLLSRLLKQTVYVGPIRSQYNGVLAYAGVTLTSCSHRCHLAFFKARFRNYGRFKFSRLSEKIWRRAKIWTKSIYMLHFSMVKGWKSAFSSLYGMVNVTKFRFGLENSLEPHIHYATLIVLTPMERIWRS